MVRAMDRRGQAGVVLDAVGARLDVHRLGLLDRLAGVAHLELGELPVARTQQLHRPAQHPAALGAAHARPHGKALAGRRDRLLHLRRAGRFDPADDLASGRVAVLEGVFAGAGDVLAADIAAQGAGAGHGPLAVGQTF